MTKPNFTVYVLPISGGAFVSQLGLLSEVYDARLINCNGTFKDRLDYEPDLVCGSSGGNIASYMALAGDWSSYGIKRVCSFVERDIFIRSWWPGPLSFMPTWLIGIFKGSIYRPGKGATEMFSSIFTKRSIQRVEIWSGTYDQTSKRTQLFTNKREGETVITNKSFNKSREMFSSLPLMYLGGDIDHIAKVVIASASIPVFVDQQNIDDRNYADGGNMFSSPLSVLYNEITTHVKGTLPPSEVHTYYAKNIKPDLFVTKSDNESIILEKAEVISKPPKRLRLVYFCSYNMEVVSDESFHGLTGTPGDALYRLIHSAAIQDRNISMMMIQALGDTHEYVHYKNLKTGKLAEILLELESQSHYAIVLYPITSDSINLTKFSSTDVHDKMETARKGYGAHVWYIKS